MQGPSRVLSESEATLESFHDCHIHGIRWRREQFIFALDLTYILEWIPPVDAGGTYRFRVCEATLIFRDADDVKLAMDWSGVALDGEIAGIRALEERTTPNGRSQRLFEFELSEPDGALSLWSTGYELELLGEPVLASEETIPGRGVR